MRTQRSWALCKERINIDIVLVEVLINLIQLHVEVNTALEQLHSPHLFLGHNTGDGVNRVNEGRPVGDGHELSGDEEKEGELKEQGGKGREADPRRDHSVWGIALTSRIRCRVITKTKGVETSSDHSSSVMEG